MTDPERADLRLAVDVGGSGLRARLLRRNAVVDELDAPGARIGPDGLNADELVAALLPIAADGGAAVAFATRGLIALSDPEDLLNALRSLNFDRVLVCSDAVSSLVGALGTVGPGAMVSAGTGAVAFGSDFAGYWRRVDGWGHVLGDRGSGAWIALTTLQLLAEFADRVGAERAARDPLFARATERFGPLTGWPRQLMTRSDAPELLAAWAPVVTELAEQPICATVIEQAGAHLGDSLAWAADGLPAGATVAYSGGVFSAEVVREAFLARCASLELEVVAAQSDSLAGASLLADQLAEGSVPEVRPPYLFRAG